MSQAQRKPRSYFWPLLLIGFGALMLLNNLGLFEFTTYRQLIPFWPVLIIVAGIQLLFKRSAPWLGSLLAVLVLLGVVFILVYAPQLGFELPQIKEVTLTTFQNSELLNEASSARVNLDIGANNLTVASVAELNNLVEVDVNTSGEVFFNVSGQDEKIVDLRVESLNTYFFNLDTLFDADNQTAIVKLSPELPIALHAKQGSGSGSYQLQDLQLSSLEAETGSGNLNLVLAPGSYPAEINSGSGFLMIESPNGTVLDLDAAVGSGRVQLNVAEEVSGHASLGSGSGSIIILLPESLGVRIHASTGSGNLNLPASFVLVQSFSNSGASSNGIWESSNFATADYQLELEVSLGSGNLRLSYP